MKTSSERPHLRKGRASGTRRISDRFVAEQAWPGGKHVHIPLRRPQQRQKTRCGTRPTGSSGHRQPAREPGHDSHPEREHPARQAHRPLGPGTASRPQAASAWGQKFIAQKRSQRRSSWRSQHPKRFPSCPFGSGVRPRVHQPSRQGGDLRSHSRRFEGRPDLAFAKSRARPKSRRAHSWSPPNTPPSSGPKVQHPRSAHPPCSRKGPLLPARGLKSPRRVKRETTNSRFLRFCGLGEKNSGHRDHH